jgi:hypothetical protein
MNDLSDSPFGCARNSNFSVPFYHITIVHTADHNNRCLDQPANLSTLSDLLYFRLAE